MAQPPQPPKSYYKVYEKAEDINYVPEDALKEGLGMVRAMKASIKMVDLGSKMRSDVWAAEIEKYVAGVSRGDDLACRSCSHYNGSLLGQGSPTTMIAVCCGKCGLFVAIHACLLSPPCLTCVATGAGKSSILNAILDGALT